MLSLAIHHNLWLTRDQRYAVHNGIELVIVGVSVPVWVANQKSTSEPAQEIFCKYNLKNKKINHNVLDVMTMVVLLVMAQRVVNITQNHTNLSL